jgi:type II secretory pathway pseudopilin PulG
LLELLIVVSVVVMLMGMLMPLINIANRMAKQTATRSVMIKVDIAARRFREDVGAYPYQRSYADPLANWTNNLAWHLGTTMDGDQYGDVTKDAKTAAAHYNTYVTTAPNNHAFNDVMLTRMAAERARIMILAGNLDVKGPQTSNDVDNNGAVITVTAKPSTDLVTSPDSDGWADDYLEGELESRYRSGQQILDAWKTPLIYVCQVTPGMTPAVRVQNKRHLRAISFGLHTLGRTTLAERDALTGLNVAAHATYLPSLTALRHSDRRFYAAPRYEDEFELWSAGPDGKADWMRDAEPANRDNLSPTPYDKELP